MKIHHLNCGSMCPACLPFLRADGALFGSTEFVCHCLLIESPAGLVLVDTGFGHADSIETARLGGLFRFMLRPSLSSATTALAQVQALGFQAADVKHIITTHLDVDHGGGIADFPDAQVHVYESEWQAANHPGLLDRMRYHPEAWQTHPNVTRYGSQGECWMGFEGVHSVAGMSDEILMVPLVGHTLGHCGVAVRHGDGWLLHCGDAYYSQLDVLPGQQAPLGMRIFATLLEKNRRARLDNLDRLRSLAADDTKHVKLICSHDPGDLC